MLKLLFVFTLFFNQGVDIEKIIGTWQVEKVMYLDQQPVRPVDGQELVLKFTADGRCLNLTHRSETNYIIKQDQLNMDGYSNTIEKLSDQQLVLRENKQFFKRRIYFKRIR